MEKTAPEPTIPEDDKNKLVTQAEAVNSLAATVEIDDKIVTTATVVGTPAYRKARELGVRITEKG